MWTISTTTLRQAVTPGALLGRVSAVMLDGDLGHEAARRGDRGAHRRSYGAEACLMIAAFGFTIQAVIILASPVRHLKRQPEMAR